MSAAREVRNSVLGNITIFLTTVMGVRSTNSFLYLDKELSSVITLYFATMMAGYSILGFHHVEIMHSFKFIRT